MVSSTCALSTVASAVLSGPPGYSQFRRCAGYSARYSDEPANHSDVKILRSTAI
jgi:hypothetical protein